MKSTGLSMLLVGRINLVITFFNIRYVGDYVELHCYYTLYKFAVDRR